MSVNLKKKSQNLIFPLSFLFRIILNLDHFTHINFAPRDFDVPTAWVWVSTCATGVTEEIVKTDERPTLRSLQENRVQKQRDADTFIYFC